MENQTEKSESRKDVITKEETEKRRRNWAEKAKVRYFIDDVRIIETEDKDNADYIIYSSIDREVESVSLLKSNTLSIDKVKRLARIIVNMEHARKTRPLKPRFVNERDIENMKKRGKG